jgi:succinate dehydrogenase / fumarate reductase flavoprotein subunit
MLDASEIKTVTHDCVVIGAGGAGLRAAVACSANGLDTAVVCKSLLGKAHTVMAEGGMAAAMGNVDKRDNWAVHFRDTVRGSKFLNDYRMAELHAKQAPERVAELEDWGAVFDRTKEGLINQRNFGGHRYPRLAHVGDRTGLELIRTLQDKGVHSGFEVYMECKALELLQDEDGRIAGVLCLWKDSGRFMVIKCKAVIMATGGGGKAWRVTSNSWEYTGDGAAMAYEAGAELMDIEFTQFHPTGMVWPPSVRGTLVTEGVRGEGGILTNSEGKRFMFNYVPERFAAETADTIEEADRWASGDMTARRPPELLTRDVVAKAITAEVKAGRGSTNGGAYLDIASRRPPEYIKKKLPSMYHQFKELAEVDITKEPMQVGPTLHYFMGGIRVDSDTQMSKVQGLFACGEASAGLHGANRLGGNSLSDLIVFGKLAGDGASDYIQGLDAAPQTSDDDIVAGIRNATACLNREDGPNPFVLHSDLQDIMGEHAGIIRSEDGMAAGLEKLTTWREKVEVVKAHGSSQYNAGWHEALDLQSLAVVSEAITRAAKMRQESRGAHTRTDFEVEDYDVWGNRNILIYKGDDGTMKVEPIERADADPFLVKVAKATVEELDAMIASGEVEV